MRHVWAAAILIASTPMTAPAKPGGTGEAAVRAAIARHGTAPIIAELAVPGGAAADVVAASRERLARALAPEGIASMRGLGDLPFVALEVDGAQLDALLATGQIVSVAPRGAATVD